MRPCLRLSFALLLSAGIGGCGPAGPNDSDPPPVVRKNDGLKPAVKPLKGGKQQVHNPRGT